MSYKQMDRRLVDLEQEAEQAAERAYTDWIESLSEAELDGLCAAHAERNPEGQAALEAMSEAELDHALSTGKMSAREWDMALLQGRELVAAVHAKQERTNAAT